MPLNAARDIEDAFYGQFTVTTDNGQVALHGPSIPTTTIARDAEANVSESIPIGTRDPAALRMTIAGASVSLAPRKVRTFSRRSQLVTVRHAGLDYRFVANSSATAQLRRGDLKVADLSLGDDGDVFAHWLITKQESKPEDAAIGYTLAIAFGTGSLSLLGFLVEAVGALFPG